jgi:TRAP-type C4-dicarboxylate transport system permease large subunit
LAITIPSFCPIVWQMKIDPVWFATVMILATQVGVITPPFALAIYAVNAVADPDVIHDVLNNCA